MLGMGTNIQDAAGLPTMDADGKVSTLDEYIACEVVLVHSAIRPGVAQLSSSWPGTDVKLTKSAVLSVRCFSKHSTAKAK